MEQYFSEIPKDENWNFVEINSTKDLLAMANPHQKKYKTKQKSSKHGSIKNNWNLFKHKFPVFLNKSEKISQNNVNQTKKDKRHIPKVVRRKKELGDPWASVDIKEEDNKRLAFGLYDEFGRKRGAKIIVNSESMQDRVTVEKARDNHVKTLKEDDILLNITIDLDGVKHREENTDATTEQRRSTENSNVELIDKVSKNFSEKLEILYEKLAALKSLEAKPTPLPPVGQVGKLVRPVALTMRQDSPLYTKSIFQPAFRKNMIPYAGSESILNQRQSRKNKGMLGILKRQLEQLVPPKLQHFLDRSSAQGPESAPAPPLPTLPPVFIPPPGHQSRSQPLSSPPWQHHGLPTQLQHHLSKQQQQKGHQRNEKTVFGLLLPRLGF